MQPVRTESLIFVAILSILFAALGLPNQRLSAEEPGVEPFPYTAYVDENGVSVLSGPSNKFYATDRLEWGTKVEVYRHDENYAAIRPPSGSFSWVPVDDVELTDETGIARVKDSNTHTRIGSSFNDEHAAEYIRLHKEELLEVFGQQELPEPEGIERKSWYKVAPPAGEFRWVRLDSLSDAPPKKKASRKGRSKPKLVESAGPSKTEEATPAVEVAAEPNPVAFASAEEPAEAPPIQKTSASQSDSDRDTIGTQSEPPGLGSKVQAFIQSIAAMTETSPSSDQKSQSTLLPPEDLDAAPVGTSVREEITTITDIADNVNLNADSSGAPEDSASPVSNHRENVVRDHAVSQATFVKPVKTLPPDSRGGDETTIADANDSTKVIPAQYTRNVTPYSPGRIAARNPPSTTRPSRKAWREVKDFSSSSQSSLGDSHQYSSLPANSSFTTLPGRSTTMPTMASPMLTSTRSPYEDKLPGALANPQTIFTGTSDKSFMKRELADINLELTNEVSQPPEFWELDELRIRTQAVIDASQVAEVRDQAQRQLARIAQFQDVQRRGTALSSRITTTDNATLIARLPGSQLTGPLPGTGTFLAQNARLPNYAGASRSPFSTGTVPSPPGFNRTNPSQPAYGAVASASQPPSQRINYDGSGWLMPVVTGKRGVPQYVLTDDNGRVLQFITPQPGVKLNSYVRQKIGVFGQKTFLPSYERPHLVAERIVTLNRVR